MRYIIWAMASLDACDVTNNGRHLGFYQELKIRLKPREIHVVVFVLYMKNNTQISTLHDFSLNIYFYCWKKLKKHVFSPSLVPRALFPKPGKSAMRTRLIFTQKWLGHLLLMTSNLVATATDHHWTCLKMCARDERTATENVRWWCFILYEKLQKKNLLGGGGGHPLPLVHPRIKVIKCGKTASPLIAVTASEDSQTKWIKPFDFPTWIILEWVSPNEMSLRPQSFPTKHFYIV